MQATFKTRSSDQETTPGPQEVAGVGTGEAGGPGQGQQMVPPASQSLSLSRLQINKPLQAALLKLGVLPSWRKLRQKLVCPGTCWLLVSPKCPSWTMGAGGFWVCHPSRQRRLTLEPRLQSLSHLGARGAASVRTAAMPHGSPGRLQEVSGCPERAPLHLLCISSHLPTPGSP